MVSLGECWPDKGEWAWECTEGRQQASSHGALNGTIWKVE